MKAARLLATLFAEAIIALVVLIAALRLAVDAIDLPPEGRLADRGAVFHAADGSLLTATLASDGRWRFVTSLERIDPDYLSMLVAYEDRRFWSHRGVDPLAVGRAAWQAFRHARSVSGASTLTMQLVRLLDPAPRSLESKAVEMLRAVKLERHWPKERILEAYLSLAPFGGNVEGVRAAALAYFGTEPGRLSPAEAALLVALPQAPESRRPDRNPQAARAARNHVLASLARRRQLQESIARTAAHQRVALANGGISRRAPHLAARLAAHAGAHGSVATLIEKGLQDRAEAIAFDALRQWDEGVNLAIVVVRNSDGAVVAYVGSGSAATPERRGFVDLARAPRSPGSALKPFIYSMAFESLIAHPDTIVADQAIDIAGYRPLNADGSYFGDMSMRQALILSRNTVPVMLLHRVGVEAFLGRFRTVGAPLALAMPDKEAGLAVALGGVGISLEQLVWFYSAFANEGELRALRWTAHDRPKSLGKLFLPPAANAVADILADVPPPMGSARLAALDGSRRIGFKTGTSYGFRDAWSVGFDKLHSVGVWIGRPDGAPHLGAYGITAAAPIMMQVFDALPVPAAGAASGRQPLGALASPRALPARLTRFGAALSTDPSKALAIAFPRLGSRIAVARSDDGIGLVPLKVTGGRPPFRLTILGREVEVDDRRENFVAIAQSGTIDVGVTDADGGFAKTSFWLE